MKKVISHLFKISALLFFVLLYSCSSGGSDDPGTTPVDPSPTNLVVNTEIVGTNAQNPNGDGSGKVNITAKADNATEYKMLINGETLSSSTGAFSYAFTAPGINDYSIIVSAYRGQKFVSKTINVKVNVQSKLVWSDEFNTDGRPDQSKWTYELGTGDNGWGNNELQTYTNRVENSVVSNGTLKINLIKENYQGSAYTSARLVSKGKYDFKYGKIEFRAKLPNGKGTWPALWMLGANIDTVPWPDSGEIDVMEHVGNQQNRLFSTLHYPGHSGGNAVGGYTMVPTISTEFHVFSAEWTPTSIVFSVDDKPYFTFPNAPNLPFNHNYFIIMNMAMGGNFGGQVDPAVTGATMEVDYVRVYQ